MYHVITERDYSEFSRKQIGEFTDFEKLDRLISKLNKLKDIENSEG